MDDGNPIDLQMLTALWAIGPKPFKCGIDPHLFPMPDQRKGP